jgi:hypothetical protein
VSVLLRQAEGFEGLSPREERANGDDLTVSQPSVNGELLVEGDLAGASSHLDPTEPENRIAEVTDLGFLELKQVPGLPYRSETAGHLVMAPVDRSLHRRRPGGHPLDIGRRVAEPQADIVLIPRIDPLAHDLHVLLRHRPRSMSNAGRCDQGRPWRAHRIGPTVSTVCKICQSPRPQADRTPLKLAANA